MRIGEVAEQTGLTISNIRFYEKKGLICPNREQQSKYRDYAREDVRRLKLIILYRKMNLSLETIGELVEGRTSTEEVLKQQLVCLREEQKKLQGSIDLCTKFVEDRGYEIVGADPVKGAADVDPESAIDAYLNYVKEEEKLGHSFAEAEELLEDFAEFTHFDRMVGFYGLGLWLMRHPLLHKVLTVLWCLMFFLLPVAVLVDRVLDGEGISPASALFWLAWFLFFAASFLRLWAQRKRNTNENG